MKPYWIISSLLVIAGLSYSCSPKHERNEKKQVIIAVIPKVDNAVFDEVKKSCIEAGEKLGIAITWEAPTSTDGKKQAELIENLIKYKVDGILISCNDVELLKEPINKAVAAGIKVATFDSDCPGSDRMFYIGTDNRRAGEICGQTMMNLFKKQNKAPQQVLVVSGGPSANNLSLRLSGFKDVIPAQKISSVVYSFEIADVGKYLIDYNLKQNKKIDAVQMVWGVPALAGVDSVPELSKFMKAGGVAVFFDVSKPLLKYIAKHPNCATMKQNFHAMGFEGINKLYNLIQDKQVPNQILYDVKVIDQTNATEELNKL